MEELLGRLLTGSEADAIRFLKNNLGLVDQQIQIDCSTLTNYCVCASNLEYFRNPSHVIQCFRKRRCFHCERYRHMQKEYESITATTNIFLAAAALGKLKLFKFLHQHGCDLESKTGIFGLRPLHLAIVNGHFKLFQYLLCQHVDVNATLLSHGTTFSPIMAAVQHERDVMVRHLVMTPGVNLTYRNAMQQTALLFAVQNNNLEVIDLLVAAEESALNAAFHRGERSLQRQLHHPCAMIEAVRQDNADVLDILLKNGCEVNYIFQGYHRQTAAIILAAVGNSQTCLQLLLNHNAQLEPEVGGFSALDWATFLDWSSCVQMLQLAKFKQLECAFEERSIGDNLNRSADSDSFSLGSSPLSDILDDEEPTLANSRPREPLIEIWGLVQWVDVCDVISRLVNLGHRVDSQDEFGRTSLHLAVEEQHVAGVRRLIQLGADTERTDVCMATPFWHAVYWNKDSMVKELLFANVVLECSAREDAYRIGLPWVDFSELQDDDAEPPSPCKVFRSTLFLAVQKNFVKLVALLLECGYDTSNEEMEALISMAKSPTRNILLEHVCQPRSLLTTVRHQIRRRYGRKIHQLVAVSGLPQRLKDCLLLRDIVDMKIEPSFAHL